MSNEGYTRRQFLKGGAGCVLGCALFGCQQSEAPHARRVSLGPIDQVPLGISFRALERLTLVRDSQGVGAMTLVCTHQTCLLAPEGGQFRCPCHGSRFSESGQVLEGPAVQPLPWYSLEVDEKGQLWADFSKTVASDWRFPI